MDQISLPRRYGIYFVVGSFVELFKLLGVRVLEDPFGPDLANALSLLINVGLSFAAHSLITWRDRSGPWWGKLTRFMGAKWVLFAIKGFAFPIWRRLPGLDCPFYDLAQALVENLSLVIPSLVSLKILFSCTWMSVAAMDLSLSLTLGFLSHDRFSFWRRNQSQS